MGSNRSKTVPVRVPDDVAVDLVTWARLENITPGELMQRAWDRWVVAHKDELLASIDEFRAKIEAR